MEKASTFLFVCIAILSACYVSKNPYKYTITAEIPHKGELICHADSIAFKGDTLCIENSNKSGLKIPKPYRIDSLK